MNHFLIGRYLLGGVICGWLLLAMGCSSLLPPAVTFPATYALDTAPAVKSAIAPVGDGMVALTLAVNPPRAAAGFDSRHMIYIRQAHQFEYFAHSEWVDTPARMLAPLIVAAIESSGSFGGVALAPSAAAFDLRLDTEILRLQQEFDQSPSRVRLTLRASLVDGESRRLLATREFDVSVVAVNDNPYGGVKAANLALRTVLDQLAGFCGDAAQAWKPRTTYQIPAGALR